MILYYLYHLVLFISSGSLTSAYCTSLVRRSSMYWWSGSLNSCCCKKNAVSQLLPGNSLSLVMVCKAFFHCMPGICCTLDDREMIRSEAERIGKNMNLSVVRLCFQAFLPDENGRFTIPLEPVFSQKVYDSSK